MARQSRESSIFGLYHVMLRGINKQNVFIDEDDFLKMMSIIHDAPFDIDIDGTVRSDNMCSIFAYCLLDNHVHLLIKERELKLPAIMKKMENRYVSYYNKKYERVGPLFQGRYASEPVNDKEYFYVLIRYIHRNPVKALEAMHPEDYPYCSWNEYVCSASNIFPVLKPTAIESVTKAFPLPDLIGWVNKNIDDDCLDMDSFSNVISDSAAIEIVEDISGVNNIETFRQLDAPTQIYYLMQAIDHGVNIRQATRIGSVTEYMLRKAKNAKLSRSAIVKNGLSDIFSSRPLSSEKSLEETMETSSVYFFDNEDDDLRKYHESVDCMKGMKRKSYTYLHSIIDYLYQNPQSTCTEVAGAVQLCNESARKLLVCLINEGLVTSEGSTNKRTYRLM